MAELYKTIEVLEQRHKRSQLMETYGELMQARRRLKDILTKRYHRSIQRSKGFFYAHANKRGRYLARLLKGNTPRTQVRNLRLSTGAMSNLPNKIAEEFREYYRTLYNIHTCDRRDEIDTGNTRIREYLEEAVTTTISPEE
ncbi:Hypothetical predicted protein, partial [Pelobates cultripes]